MSWGLIGKAIVAVCATGFAFFTAAQAENVVRPVDHTLCAEMKSHHVLNPGAPVGCERLRLVKFDYIDFEGTERDDGKIVVMDAVADHVLRIFEALHQRHFPIAKAKLMQAYDGNDHAAMADDNTSSFNDRDVPDTSRISLHAYGLAIDLNPVENPFITRNGATFTVEPAAGADYVNRLIRRPGKPERRGFAETVVDIFAENGFTVWGGNWDNPIDYQHFDVGRAMAEKLASLPAAQAKEAFEESITAYLNCRAQHCSGDRVTNGCDIPCK